MLEERKKSKERIRRRKKTKNGQKRIKGEEKKKRKRREVQYRMATSICGQPLLVYSRVALWSQCH